MLFFFVLGHDGYSLVCVCYHAGCWLHVFFSDLQHDGCSLMCLLSLGMKCVRDPA